MSEKYFEKQPQPHSQTCVTRDVYMPFDDKKNKKLFTGD
jgi:hypothetical protein